MTGPDVMKEICLPPKEAFYDALNEKDISDEKYKHAQRMWNELRCETMRDYHDFYLKLDVFSAFLLFLSTRSSLQHLQAPDYLTRNLFLDDC